MNQRRREYLSTPLVTTTLTLARYLHDKSTQARKLVQLFDIAPILRESQSLWRNVLALLDGMDTQKKALQNLNIIQMDSIRVAILERDNRLRKVNTGKDGKPKRKKHYGFDAAACTYIDELCDNLKAQICAFGQSHQPYNRG